MQSRHSVKKKVQSSSEGERTVKSGNEAKEKVQSKNGKKALKKIITELKKEIIEKHDCGIRVTDLALEYKITKFTISTILKNKDVFKGADVAKGITMLTKQRVQVLEEVGKLVFVWLNGKQLVGDSIHEAMICEKARKLNSDLLKKQKNLSTRTTSG